MTAAGTPAAAVLHKTQMGALRHEGALLIQTNKQNKHRLPAREKSKHIQYNLLDVFLVYVT